MSPFEIAELRKELRCTAKELAGALAVEQGEVLSWEKGETFPTKRLVEQMEKLREKGPDAIVRKKKVAPTVTKTPQELLADPAFWGLVSLLATDPSFRSEVTALAAKVKGGG